jgi:hypothetical protein
MATKRAAASKRSSNPKMTRGSQQKGAKGPRSVARAHRDDTFEAREQQRRAPKTHPTRAIGSRRKDADEKPKSRAAGGSRDRV